MLTYYVLTPKGQNELQRLKESLPNGYRTSYGLSNLVKQELSTGTIQHTLSLNTIEKIFGGQPVQKKSLELLFHAINSYRKRKRQHEVPLDDSLYEDSRGLPSSPKVRNDGKTHIPVTLDTATTNPAVNGKSLDTPSHSDSETYIQIDLLADLLKSAARQGVLGIYHRKDPHQEALLDAIKDAHEFLYISGRTHKNMLIKDEEEGWALPEIVAKVKSSPNLPVHIILANGFDKECLFAHQLRLRNKGTSYAARESVREFFRLMDPRIGSEHGIEVRVAPHAPYYCSLITEKECFFEPYLPSQSGGKFLILRLSNSGNDSAYDSVKADFIRQFAEAQLPSIVMDQYVTRERAKKAAGEEWDEQKQKMITAAEEAIKIAKRWNQ